MKKMWPVSLFVVFLLISSTYGSCEDDGIEATVEYHKFRAMNRRSLRECIVSDPYIEMKTSVSSGVISDEENITVVVSGISKPSDEQYWVAMISPSRSNVDECPLNAVLYKETGDLSHLPLLCHYPVKAMKLNSDPELMSCKKAQCSASLTFHVINIRSDIEFILFAGGFDAPCILRRTPPLRFSNPNAPLHGHLSSIDSTATSMRLTWVSGSKDPQQVEYGDGKSQTSQVISFTQDDVCGHVSPAKDFGWHDPGYIHTASMTGLNPSTNFSYRYGSNSVGWSERIEARTPPVGGSDEVKIIAFGDMGKAPLDNSIEHYIQPGSISVVSALANEVASGKVDAIFHIGDISYATGFLVEWDYFLGLINPIAKRVSYMTAIGNHERDYLNSGSVYPTPDSGGECGVPYETYFRMPTSAKDKPWYSIEMASVHLTLISTEHEWRPNSEQYEWMRYDMASVNRSRTPWLVFAGHRPMYSTSESALLSVDLAFVGVVEPLLQQNKVDVALFGHVHNYERTCAVYSGECKAMPVKGEDGIDTFDNTQYSAPVQAVIGMAGFKLDGFSPIAQPWSLVKISKYGYARIHATREEFKFEFVNSNTTQVEDSFRIIKKHT